MTLSCIHDWRPSQDPTERGIWVCDFCYHSTTQPAFQIMTGVPSNAS